MENWVFAERKVDDNGNVQIPKERYEKMLNALVAIASVGFVKTGNAQADFQKAFDTYLYCVNASRNALEWGKRNS